MNRSRSRTYTSVYVSDVTRYMYVISSLEEALLAVHLSEVHHFAAARHDALFDDGHAADDVAHVGHALGRRECVERELDRERGEKVFRQLREEGDGMENFGVAEVHRLEPQRRGHVHQQLLVGL
eukprot:CAMPEP_0170158722 /NCGR_PEP_ID=MMETSP0033_2-20121228/68946_1 /TAXON_ID=195969 /ORGANISM="Dolichomastix tenuilepis, Strain CCMP3274" /LENGTH=123 /DNA_ID=CAMNT_0010396171 /DNA_START=561 /DNA_END=927 /DNA_ORIENTATION=-